MNNVQEYVFLSCQALQIAVQKHPSHFELTIPEGLVPYFNASSFSIVFEENENPAFLHITEESYLLHKIAHLMTIMNEPYSAGYFEQTLDEIKKSLSGVIEKGEVKKEMKHYVYVWYKTKIQANDVEEFIKGFRVDMTTHEVIGLGEGVSELSKHVQPFQPKNIRVKDVEEMIEYTNQSILTHTRRFIRVKQHEYNERLQKEIERINQYYKTLQQENSGAEAHISKQELSFDEEKELLKKEKENLIGQQRVKFQIKEDQIQISPVAILYVKAVLHTQLLSYSEGENRVEKVVTTDKYLQ